MHTRRTGKINHPITGDWYSGGNECNETGVPCAEMDKKCLSKMHRRTSHKYKKRDWDSHTIKIPSPAILRYLHTRGETKDEETRARGQNFSHKFQIETMTRNTKLGTNTIMCVVTSQNRALDCILQAAREKKITPTVSRRTNIRVNRA